MGGGSFELVEIDKVGLGMGMIFLFGGLCFVEMVGGNIVIVCEIVEMVL